MLESLEIHRSEPMENYRYEWIAGVAHYAVDPDAPANARIADLGLAPRDGDGLVRFSGDVVLLRPVDGGNRRALLSVPNRGGVRLPLSGAGIVPGGVRTPPSPGDGYLLEHGWTIAIPGWQWDVPRDIGLAGFDAPVAAVEPGWMRGDFWVETPLAERSVGDMLPLVGGNARPTVVFAPYPATDTDQSEAALLVRSAQLGPAELIPRSQWRFTSPTSITLDGGFQPFHWYELIYRSSFAPVVGTGLLALRDFGAYLHSDADFVFADGISQCGRLLRQFLFDGLNVDERGQQVFDGVLAEIASARRGEFNRRYAQPGLLHPPLPEYGPPYDSTSLLARQRALGGVPKVVLNNSSWEYWRGDGALVHQDPVTGADLPEDPDVRSYLISGTDHLGPTVEMKTSFPLGNPPHNLDPAPVVRALFVQLVQWVVDGTEPAPSVVPRQADGTAVTRAAVLESFPDAARPEADALPYTAELDPDDIQWPLKLGEPRVALVSAVDAAGNEIGGIRLPAVETGIAAYTGWNPRRHVDGLPDVLYDLTGGRLPAPEPQARPGEPEIRAAAQRLADNRFLLDQDIELAVRQALAELPAE
jgi:Alpha/beta hydrolase domain